MSGGKKYWIGFGVGAAFLALFFLTTDWGRLVDSLADANYWFLVPAILLYQFSLLFRTVRWRMLLRHVRVVPITRLYPVVVVGYMANNLLPFRIGELVRSYHVGKREGVSKATALVTIFIERLLDALTLLMFVAVVAIFVPVMAVAEGFGDRSSVPWPALAAAISVPFAVAFGALVLVAYAPARASRMSRIALSPLPMAIESRAKPLVDMFIHGLEALRSPLSVLMLFALSVPVWLFDAALFFVIGYSFDLHLAYDGFVEMAVAIVLVTALANMGGAIPATPGGIGMFELVARETLVLLPMAVVDRSTAAAYAAVVHAALLLPMIGLGQPIPAGGEPVPRQLAERRAATGGGRTRGAGMRVGIVGAGAAGLTAAYELGKQGHEAVVYERAPFLGGQASTFDVNGARLERGYHHLFTSDTDIIELVEEIGLGRQMRWIDSKVGTLYDGRIYNFVTPMDLMRFEPLSPVNRMRLGLVTLMLQRMKDWRRLEAVTAVDWLRKWAGESAFEGFWGPMLRGKFGEGYYQQVGMPWIWGKIATRLASRKGLGREKLGYPIGSFGEIFDTLSDRIAECGNRVHLSTPVTRILTGSGGRPVLETTWPGGTSRTESFDAVIATTHSYMFLKLAPALAGDYRARLESARYLAAALLVLVLDRPLSHIYWLNVADPSIPFVAVIEHTNLIGPEHYGGQRLVYLSNYLDRGDRLYAMDREELMREYVPHLRKVNPDFDPSWIVKIYHQRVNAAQPVIGTNYSERMPEHRTPLKGVYLANTTQIYPEDRGTNYSVRMGKRVAEMVMEDMG